MSTDTQSSEKYPTTIDHRFRINNAAKFVIGNLSEPLEIKAMAEVANFSSFHFHRVFKRYVGESPADYVKKTRMKRAATLLLSGVKVSEVAVEIGYSTMSAFTKAFRKTFGSSPSEFKRCRENEFLNFSVSYTEPRTFTRPAVVVKIVDEPPFRLYSIRKKVSPEGVITENIGKAAQEAFNVWSNIIRSEGLDAEVFRKIGIIRNLNSVNPGKYFYDGGITFKSEVNLSSFDEIEVTEIKAGKWATFIHWGPYNTLWQTYRWISNHWLWQSGYELREERAFEVYLNDSDVSLPQDLQTIIYLPIQ